MKVRTAHCSLQFGLSDAQHTADIEKLFATAVEENWAWFTGTESGPGAGNTAEELVRVARESGYKPWVPRKQSDGSDRGEFTDHWVMVREDLITGDYTRNYEEVIPGSAQLYKAQGLKPDLNPRWGPKGVCSVVFENDKLGTVGVASSHYLTGARHPGASERGVDHWAWNEKLANAIADWADEVSKGNVGLAFYGGDQNMADDKNDQPQGDTFFGRDLTSAWDELGFHQGSGHGNIDVIASHDRDKRVTAKKIWASNDEEFFLHSDHYLVRAVYKIDTLPVTPPPPVLKPLDVVAQEVIAGLWGVGEDRRTRLTAAGYNYDEVQARVAELLAPKPVEHPCLACGFVHMGVIPTPSR